MLFVMLSACFITPQKVVSDYEWFHSTFQEVQSRTAQIKATSDMIASEENAAEVRRLRVEQAGQSQSCRDMVAAYNARSEMVTRSAFQGWSLPDHLDPLSCSTH